MSGRGRQAYHGQPLPHHKPTDGKLIQSGVPRIMEGTLPEVFRPLDSDDSQTKAVKRYISTARVNINARQVFPPGFERSI